MTRPMDTPFDVVASRRGLLAGGIALGAAMLDWFKSYDLPNPDDANNAYSSPLLALDHSGLPPASIVHAEIGPLFSQGTA